MGAGVHMDWGLVGFGCWSARLEEKPSSNLDRKRGIMLREKHIAIIRLLPPSIFLFDARNYSIGYTGLSINFSGCASLELSGTRGIYFSLLILPFPIYIYLSTVLRSFYLGVLILLFFFTRFSKSLWIRTCNA